MPARTVSAARSFWRSSASAAQLIDLRLLHGDARCRRLRGARQSPVLERVPHGERVGLYLRLLQHQVGDQLLAGELFIHFGLEFGLQIIRVDGRGSRLLRQPLLLELDPEVREPCLRGFELQRRVEGLLLHGGIAQFENRRSPA